MLGGGLAKMVVDKVDGVEVVCEDVSTCVVVFGESEDYKVGC